jgi:phage repressor protein C with HTH and peptisase S24 domain
MEAEHAATVPNMRRGRRKGTAMLTHAQVWKALDALAQRHGLTVSGLARKAKLDPTTFNKSKRIATDGRARWPSTESIAKVLDATGESVDGFITMLGGSAATPARVKIIGLAQAGAGGYFDETGSPTGSGWDELDFPGMPIDQVYALEITGDSMLPLYRDGDMILVSPAAQIRRGDRVVVKTTGGEVMAKELKRRTSTMVELASLNPEHPDRQIAASEIAWMGRIVWASQ